MPTQLDKWNKELERLSNRSYKEMDSKLYQHYKRAMRDLKREIKVYIENYDNLSFSKKLEADNQVAVAKRIDEILWDLEARTQPPIEQHIRNEVETGYYGTWYAMEGANNIQLDFGFLNESYIEGLVHKKVAGKSFSKRLYEHRTKLANTVTTELLTGARKGKGYAWVAKNVAEQTEANYKQALRIARTEGGRVQSTATQRSYKEAEEKGVQLEKMWMATLDKKTRHQHQILDGQTVGVDEPFNFGGYEAEGPRLFGVAGLDINCRCTTVAVVNGLSPAVRRDNESGEIVEYKNFNEWAEVKGYKEKQNKQQMIKENGRKISGEILEHDRIHDRMRDEWMVEADIQDLRNRILNSDNKAERKRLRDELALRYENEEITTSEYNKGLAELRERFSKNNPTAELRVQLNKKETELIELQQKNAYENAKDVKEVLSKYRDMGIKDIDLSDHIANGRHQMAKTLTDAYDYYPTEWVQRSVDYGKIRLKKTKRGYYSHDPDESVLALSGRVGKHNSFRTAIHELGHRQEFIFGDLLEAEKEFYEYRTKGEDLVRLKDAQPRARYKADEVTKVDKFLNPYMGKDYGGQAYEVFTMAADTLFTNPTELILRDKEMLEWVLGVLTTL